MIKAYLWATLYALVAFAGLLLAAWAFQSIHQAGFAIWKGLLLPAGAGIAIWGFVRYWTHFAPVLRAGFSLIAAIASSFLGSERKGDKEYRMMDSDGKDVGKVTFRDPDSD